MMSEWPKKWDDITEKSDENGIFHFQNQWIEYQNGLRGYNGTLYASVDVGNETKENRNLWLPLDEYINQKT